jgi:clan AA aspartic protease (TIGR02281 family)
MNRPPPWLALCAPISAALLLPLSAAAQRVAVADELERLAAQHGFEVYGVEATEEALGRADGDELFPRLRRLLENFDHVILQSAEGGVERVIVLGEKAPFVPPPAPAPGDDGADTPAADGEIVLATQRRGTQHAVEVSVEGQSGKRVQRNLLVDTGADYLVLPSSAIADLGLAADKLEEREMQTANGRVKARVGLVPAVWLEAQRVPDVVAAFIDGEKLGNGGLLGMSVLARYTMTIDDAAGRLTLTAKGAGAESADAGSGKGAEGSGTAGND